LEPVQQARPPGLTHHAAARDAATRSGRPGVAGTAGAPTAMTSMGSEDSHPPREGPREGRGVPGRRTPAGGGPRAVRARGDAAAAAPCSVVPAAAARPPSWSAAEGSSPTLRGRAPLVHIAVAWTFDHSMAEIDS